MRRPCCVWFVVNLVFLRPLFTLVNNEIVSKWRCPPDGGLDGGRELEALVVGHGRTGTTSMTMALRRLGLKTFKSIDANFYLSDIIDRVDNISAEQVEYRVRSCGLGAMTLEQIPALLPILLKAFPRVKVVFLKRDWRTWAESSKTMGTRQMPWQLNLASHLFCHWLPYAMVWPSEGIGVAFYEDSVTSTFLVSCFLDLYLIPYRPTSMPFVEHERKAILREKTFREMRNWAWNLVPKGNFLEFDVRRDGWDELAGFLDRRVPRPREPFPWLNTGQSAYQITKAKLFPGSFIRFWLLMLLSIAVNFVVFMLTARCCSATCARACGCCGASKESKEKVE